MPVIRVDNFVDAYALRSLAKDVHELAARPERKFLTEFVNRQILEAIQPQADDFLVDIGCGDASLLRMVGDRCKCLGIVGTSEEQVRLQSEFPGVSVIAASAQSLPLPSASASKIVCNATLFYLPTEADVAAALREMARIARPGAAIWIGEIPEIDEFAHYGIYQGNSMLAFLWHLLQNNGPRAFFGMIRRWLRALFGKEQIVLNSAGIFYAKPEHMVKMAGACGLVLKRYFRHKEIDHQGNVVDSPFRYDYLFTV